MTAAARFAVPRVDGAPTWYESAAYARVAAIDSALEIVDDSRGEANKTRNVHVTDGIDHISVHRAVPI